MPLRTFHLDGSGSQTVVISQARGEPIITISLNDRTLGTLAAPKGQSASSDFTLDDGSILTVRLVKRQVQVRHNGLPLFPSSPKGAASSVLWTKRVMLTCAILAPILGIISVVVSLSTLVLVSAFIAAQAMKRLPPFHQHCLALDIRCSR